MEEAPVDSSQRLPLRRETLNVQLHVADGP